jgi:hypothetical protein
MRHLEIVIEPDLAALAIGGRSTPSHGGDRATAHDTHGRLMVPASALRGALRIELERLLASRDPVEKGCSANREEHLEPEEACACAVCRLFGDAGVAAGALRLDDVSATSNPPVCTRRAPRCGGRWRSLSWSTGSVSPAIRSSSAWSTRVPPSARRESQATSRAPPVANAVRAACLREQTAGPRYTSSTIWSPKC